MEKTFRFSNAHADFQARDAKSVFGWRYSPRIIFASVGASNSPTWTAGSTTI